MTAKPGNRMPPNWDVRDIELGLLRQTVKRLTGELDDQARLKSDLQVVRTELAKAQEELQRLKDLEALHENAVLRRLAGDAFKVLRGE